MYVSFCLSKIVQPIPTFYSLTLTFLFVCSLLWKSVCVIFVSLFSVQAPYWLCRIDEKDFIPFAFFAC